VPPRRGTTSGANCTECPFAIGGVPGRPITAEYPEKPLWILVGEGPTRTEVQVGRPLCSAGVQQTIDKALIKIGRRRDELVLTTAVLCNSPIGQATEQDKERAVAACGPRLRAELAQWPGLPVLTIGAVAARAVIPKATLDAIDPPSVPKTKKRSQKERQKAEAKLLAKSAKRCIKEIARLANNRLKEIVKYRRTQIYTEKMTPLPGEPFRKRKKPPKELVDRELEHELPRLKAKADADAITEYELGAKVRELQEAHAAANPKPKKPAKRKPIKITDIVSTCFDVDIDGSGSRPVIPTIHPLTLLKGGGATIGGTHTPDLAFINLIYDISKVDSLARGIDVRLKLNIETETKDPERTWQLLRDIIDMAIVEGEVAIDLETYVDDPERHHALMAYMARIRTIGFATEHRAISIMWDLIPSWAMSFIQLLLAHPGVTQIYHNGLYDRTVLAANGFTCAGPWSDSLLAHHAAFPGNAHRLQTVTSQFFAVEPWKSDFRNNEETPESLTLYNSKDAGGTRALMPALTIMVKKTKTEKIYALDKKMSEIASKMHLAGMPVDREVNSELLKTFSKNVAESRRAVDAVAEDPKLRKQIWNHLAIQQAAKIRKNDPSEFTKLDGSIVRDLEARYYTRLQEIEYDTKWKWKIGSGKHIAALLQALSVPLHQVTATGQISTKKDILESLAHVPVVRDILTFRENDKLLSTFVWRLMDRFDRDGNLIQHGYADDNDRIHPIWSVHKITGRWASSEPVVSNVPKDKFRRLADGTKQVIRPNLRRQIVAPPGRMFVGFDFQQLEARVIALISGDPFLCKVFADGEDIHKSCARVVFQNFDSLPKDDQKQARDLTKSFEFGAFYGGSVETLWRNLVKGGKNIKLVDVAKAVQTLMGRMPGVVQWQRDCVSTALQPPYEIREFLYGRRRTFPLGQVEATEAMNFTSQSAGASIMNTGMAIADEGLKAYKQAFAIVQVHDSTIFECWADDAPKLAEDVNRWFHQEHERDGRSVPFSVDVKIAQTWADA
jgi:uracil-DNA glycosylase family 4